MLSTLSLFWQRPDLFSGKKIVVIGDIALDRTFLCDTSVPGRHAVHGDETIFDVRPGGDDFGAVGASNNTSLFCRSLGVEVLLISAAGVDPEGNLVADLLAAQGVPFRLLRLEGVQTVTRFRVFAAKPASANVRLVFRVDKDPDTAASYELASRQICDDSFLAWFRQEIDSANVVLFNDTDKGLLSGTAVTALAREIHAVSARRVAEKREPLITVVDPKREWEKYAVLHPDILKPNHVEACAAAGIRVCAPDSDEGLNTIAEQLCIRFGHSFPKMVVTLGAGGALAVECRDGRADAMLFPALPPPDVSRGIAMHCGDMFSSALALALSVGNNLSGAVTFANCAGSFQVGKPVGEKLACGDLAMPASVDYIRRKHVPPRHLTGSGT